MFDLSTYTFYKEKKVYTETNKGFTIITNFGCDQGCKYCITRAHPILKNKTTDEAEINWNYLEKCISETTAPTINLSGGGDPFFHWEKHLDFYNRVYDIAKKYGKRLDVHTRILPSNELLSKFRKIGLTVEYWNEKQYNILKERVENGLLNITKVRVIEVVGTNLTEEICRNYIEKIKKLGITQITFRQMFGNKKAFEHWEELKPKITGDGIMFLKDGEYHNYYFTTENKVFPYFFGTSEKDREFWKKKYEDLVQTCA